MGFETYGNGEVPPMLYPVADAHCDRLLSCVAEPAVTPQSLRAGHVAMQVYALFSGPQGPMGDPYGIVRRELALFSQIIAESGRRGWEIRHSTEPHLPEAYTAAMLSIEGGECLQGSMTRLQEFSDEGVRMIALTWNHENEIGFPSKKDDGGLKPFGLQLLREMEKRHIAVDVSHLGEKGFLDVEARCGPFMATHSNAKALCGHHRNLTDAQIKAIILHRGFIGVNFFPLFLNGSQEDGGATVEDIVRHIDYIVQMGGDGVVGFGSDFDGITERPRGIENPAGFPEILRALEDRGYPEEALARIAGQNLVDFLERV
jgi:membrane dipeptidase